jgi:hypothetical protein
MSAPCLRAARIPFGPYPFRSAPVDLLGVHDRGMRFVAEPGRCDVVR